MTENSVLSLKVPRPYVLGLPLALMNSSHNIKLPPHVLSVRPCSLSLTKRYYNNVVKAHCKCVKNPNTRVHQGPSCCILKQLQLRQDITADWASLLVLRGNKPLMKNTK